jgi:hypothetical protein
VIEIRNLLSQPLTFQLAGEEQGLHLRSRQRKQIEDTQVSEEMRTAAKAGFVILTELEQPDEPEAQPATSELPDNPTDNIPETNEEPGTDESARAATPAAEDGGSGVAAETTEQSEETTNEPRSRKRR